MGTLSGCAVPGEYATVRARNELVGAENWQQPLDDNVVARAAEVLRLLADATRLRLLALLAEGPQDVTTLATQGGCFAFVGFAASGPVAVGQASCCPPGGATDDLPCVR